MRLDAAIADATARLSRSSQSPRLDAEILLCRTIDMPRSYLFAHPEDELDQMTLERFENVIARRIEGEPMAYIMGMKEFWSLDLAVSPATLVPRPETELLVDLALREIPRKAEWDVLDLGTGSGAIAVAIASERPMCRITAIDVSEEALAVARENVRNLSLGNVELAHGSWTTPVRGQTFNLIVSNPPYVRSDDTALLKLQHEPLSALAAGVEGLDAIRVLVAECGAIMADDGVFLIEHGGEQKDDVAALLEKHGWKDICCHNDLAGHPRVTVARKGGK